MRHVIYVVRDNDRWKVEAGTQNLGPYSTRTEAIQAAAAAASAATRNARSTLIMAQIENPSTWERIWTPDRQPAAAE